MTQNTDPPHRLSPWNPLDHLRLLWWILVTPQQLASYHEACGKNAERNVSTWLVSTLACLPPFLLTLALGLETLPHTELAPPSIIFLWLSAAVALVWLLSAWLGRWNFLDVRRWFIGPFDRFMIVLGIQGCLAFGIVGIIFYCLHHIWTVNTVGKAVATLALGMAISVSNFVLGNVMGDVNKEAAGAEIALTIIIYGLGTMGTAVFVIIPSATHIIGKVNIMPEVRALASAVVGILTFVVSLLVLIATIEVRPKRQVSTILLLASYAFIIWFAFLGGWRIFQ